VSDCEGGLRDSKWAEHGPLKRLGPNPSVEQSVKIKEVSQLLLLLLSLFYFIYNFIIIIFIIIPLFYYYYYFIIIVLSYQYYLFIVTSRLTHAYTRVVFFLFCIKIIK